MPIDKPEKAPRTARILAKRASTAVSGTVKTPTKRQKISSDLIERLMGDVVKNVPDRLIQPPKLVQLVAEMLDDTHKQSAMALANFSFAVASPYALGQLQQASSSVHDFQRRGAFQDETSVCQSMQALDRIDMNEQVSPILRRYHLARLVQWRDSLQKDHIGSLTQSPIHALDRSCHISCPSAQKITIVRIS